MAAPNTADDFFAKVDRNGPIPAHCPELGPCHLWLGSLNPKGYGRMMLDGKRRMVHAIAFYFAHGRWPEPCACHHCDNRACVNDAHIFEGTQADNNRDMWSKGRGVTLRGEEHGRAKLTNQQVNDIRANALLCRVSFTELANRYGVTPTSIGRIVGRMPRGVRKRLPEHTARGDKSGSRLHPERLVRGERQWKAKLTEADVRELRTEYALGKATQVQLAARYGIPQPNISAIIRRKSWAHVSP